MEQQSATFPDLLDIRIVMMYSWIFPFILSSILVEKSNDIDDLIVVKHLTKK